MLVIRTARTPVIEKQTNKPRKVSLIRCDRDLMITQNSCTVQLVRHFTVFVRVSSIKKTLPPKKSEGKIKKNDLETGQRPGVTCLSLGS